MTYPESVDITISACDGGGAWHACLDSLVGRYSQRVRLLPPNQAEVTGPTGNTNQANFCAQVTELNALGFVAANARWYMIQAVQDHEDLHLSRFEPALKNVAPQIEADIQALSVPDTGQTEAAAIAQIRALAAFQVARNQAYNTWLGECANLIQNDHNGPTDAVEHAVVDPMISAICAHAKANGWAPPCPVCPP